MPTTTPVHDIELIIENIGGGGGGVGKPPGGGDGGSGDNSKKGPKPTPPSATRYYTGMALGIVSVLMFFMALASAFLVRRGSTDWIPVHLPPVLWVNTAILLSSSASLELARRRLARADLSGFRKLWLATTVLGLLFLTGQVVVWGQLAAQGVFIASNPASSFFYIFTAAHAVHLFGGVGALVFVSVRKFERARISLFAASEITSYYWHFMDALWVFLLALLYMGK